METQLSRSKFLRLVAASSSLLVLPRGPLADDAEITFDVAVSDPDAPKDWPILTETSIVGARLASAAKYQGQYLAVHQALTDIPGYGISGKEC